MDQVEAQAVIEQQQQILADAHLQLAVARAQVNTLQAQLGEAQQMIERLAGDRTE